MERRLAAILAADVVGYSRLMAADEAGTLAALKRHREILRPGRRRPPPACGGSGTRSVVGITVSTCKQCNGSGQRRCEVCGGAAEVEPDTLQRFTRAEHSA